MPCSRQSAARALAALAVVVSAAAAPGPIVEGDLAALQSRMALDRGHPLLVNFWATWCLPCVQEIPLLNELQEGLGADGLRLLAVSLDPFVYDEPKEAQQKVARIVTEKGFGLPVFLYTGEQESLQRAYDLPGGLPHTILVAPDGTILDRVEGRLEEGEVERLTGKIRALLGPRTP